MTASVWDFFNARTDVDTDTTAHGVGDGGGGGGRVCANTVRESTLNVGSWRKLPWRTGDSNASQYCAWPFSRTFC